MKFAPPTVLATTILLAFLLVALPGCGRQSEASPAVKTETAARVAPAAAITPVPLERATTRVKRGESLDFTLRRLDVAANQRFVTTRALASEVDLRRILPGEEVEIARDEQGALREVTLRRDARLAVIARFHAETDPTVETLRVEPEKFVRTIRGRVDGSLYEAVLDAGGDANLVMRFADLLAWQVDFLTEPRPGDRFRILVEEERLAGEHEFGKILAAEYLGAQASARAIRYADSQEILDWYDDAGRSVRRAFLKSPLNFRRISSRFTSRRRHPILKTVQPHYGVDYAAAIGTPISALGAGVVHKIGRNGGFGHYIEIRHNGVYTTCYGHLSRYAKGMRKGARVEQGQVIGYVGSTGLSTGPHLDFRVRRNGRYVDPLRLDSPPGRSISEQERPRFADHLERVWRLAGQLGPNEVVPTDAAWARVTPFRPRPHILALAP